MTPEERREYQRQYREAHREEIRAKKKIWKQANVERVRAKDRAYSEAHREEIRERSRQWYRSNRARSRANQRRWKEQHPERWRELVHRSRRASNLKRYGLTVAAYDALLAAQDGKCAICHRPEWKQRGKGIQRLAVDHDHRTERIRKLLCYRCNSLLGHVEDDAALLRAAAEYLDAHAA